MSSTKRYFLEDDGKDGQSFRPGEISQELRFALGIAPDKLPIWIYRMRALGYPPGWLKKAQVSSLNMFDSDQKDGTSNGSNKRRHPDLDEGEIVDETAEYDHSSLIVYPGFNAPMPEGVIDCHYYLGMPSMMAHQQLDYAKIHLKTPKPLPKSKRLRTSEVSDESFETLETTTDTSNKPTTSDSPSSPDSPTRMPSCSASTPSHDTIKIDEATTPSGILKKISESHPMPNNPKKPDLEKFSEGMSDLIYFNNLPNYTGIFDRVRKVLNDARNKTPEKQRQDTPKVSTPSETSANNEITTITIDDDSHNDDNDDVIMI